MWDVDLSCWRVIPDSLNVALIQGTNCYFNMFRLTFSFIFVLFCSFSSFEVMPAKAIAVPGSHSFHSMGYFFNSLHKYDNFDDCVSPELWITFVSPQHWRLPAILKIFQKKLCSTQSFCFYSQ